MKILTMGYGSFGSAFGYGGSGFIGNFKGYGTGIGGGDDGDDKPDPEDPTGCIIPILVGILGILVLIFLFK